jgi:hypothetical protein
MIPGEGRNSQGMKCCPPLLRVSFLTGLAGWQLMFWMVHLVAVQEVSSVKDVVQVYESRDCKTFEMARKGEYVLLHSFLQMYDISLSWIAESWCTAFFWVSWDLWFHDYAQMKRVKKQGCFVNPLNKQDSGWQHRDSLLPTLQATSYAIRTCTAWTDSFFVWRRCIVWSVELARFCVSHYIVERSQPLTSGCSYHNGITVVWKNREDDVNSRYEFTCHLFISQSRSVLPYTVQNGAVAACFVSPQEDGIKSDRASLVRRQIISTKKSFETMQYLLHK